MSIRFASSVVVLACAAPVLAGTPSYTVEDIGALDDLTDTVPSPPTSTALAVSDAGVVGGSSWVSGGSIFIDKNTQIAEPITVHAVTWFDGVLTDIGVLGEDALPNEFPRPSAFVNSINLSGHAVGDADVLADGVWHGFLHLPEPAYGLPAGMNEVPPLEVYARAWGISDNGVIVGETRQDPGDLTSVAVSWTVDDGAWTINNLGTMGGIGSIAYGVNDLDQITGTLSTGLPENTTHAFLYLPEPAYGLPAGATTITEGFEGSIGRDINDLGQVAGRGPGWSPMLWLPEPAYGLPAGVTFFPVSTMFDQETLDANGFLGVAFAEFYAINNDGTAVGNVQVFFEIFGGQIVFSSQGFAWINGVFFFTDNLLSPGAGWDDIHFSWDVNDDGQIVGSGLTSAGEFKGYVMTPDDTVPGDVDGDGDVDTNDLLDMLAQWGPCPMGGPCPADLDDDGMVAVGDLLILLANWSG